MAFEKEHNARVRLPGIFSKKTFKETLGGSVNLPGAGLVLIPEDVSVISAKIIGREKSRHELLVQSLRFPAESWTPERALKWLEDKKLTYLLFENALKSKVMNEKEILLYTSIYGNTAQMFIEKMSEIPKDEDITIRLNCPGGSVFAGWGIIAKMKEHTGRIKIKVDGHAASFGAFMLLYADEVECIDPAQFMIHRASGYVENEDDQKLLDSVNNDLQTALAQRIDAEQFKKITNLDIKDLFSAEKRRDLWFTAKEAKKIGLVNKITRIKPTEIDLLNSKMVAFADFSESVETHVEETTEIEETERVSDTKKATESINKNLEIMTKDEFITANPTAYKDMISGAKADGVKAENVRVKSLLAFLKYDQENVLKMIKDGTEFTTDIQAELLTKMTANVEAAKIEADNAEDLKTDDAKTPEALKQEEIEAETKKVLAKL